MTNEINLVRNKTPDLSEISNGINWGIGVKAVIFEDGKILMIRRRLNDPHNPGQWDLPGGRINPVEVPQDGLIRETKEETNLDIKVLLPLDIQHFTRQDGQIINLIFFLCKKTSNKIKLSEEHIEHSWVSIQDQNFDFPVWFKPVLKNLFKITHLSSWT